MIPKYLTNFNSDKLESKEYEIIIVGSGIAGLFTALEFSANKKIAIINKDEIEKCNTYYAQGGIAAVISEDDDVKSHINDTLKAGNYFNNLEAVSFMVENSRNNINKLISYGVNFDKDNNNFSLTKEGAHSKKRVLYSGGDATGKEIIRALKKNIVKRVNINMLNNYYVVDLLTNKNKCYGVLSYNKFKNKFEIIKSKVVILATGGLGSIYKNTSNPKSATGDGIALAYRAGVKVMDMEFIQFHPTTLKYNNESIFLISEAIRGEGGILRNKNKQRFMFNYHKDGELAPRDIVSRSIYYEMKKTNSNEVFLDITHLNSEFIIKRFPNIYKKCLDINIDITEDLIPVVPAAHYTIGGIKVDMFGRTNIIGLYSVGEAASIGLHGSNRLASNSLLDGITFTDNLINNVNDYMKNVKIENMKFCNNNKERTEINIEDKITSIKNLMSNNVSIIKNEEEMKKAEKEIRKEMSLLKNDCNNLNIIEYANILINSYLIIKSSILRKESRGVHFRDDYSFTDEKWDKHIVMRNIYKGDEIEYVSK